MLDKQILYALNSEKPRRHQNGWFEFCLLCGSIICAIITAVFFVLASKNKDSFNNFYQYLAYIMLLCTISALCLGTFFAIKRKKYINLNKSIYASGKRYNATILDTIKNKVKTQNNEVYINYAIKFSFIDGDDPKEAITKSIFEESQIDYYKFLNYFPIVYSKECDQYLYILYVDEK